MIMADRGRMHRLVPGVVLALLSLLATGFRETSEPRVAHFTPHGIVKRVRQVTARFTEPMVALGDPRAVSIPFDVDCPEPGTPRWADSRTWVYDFDRDLPGGVRCTFRVRDGVKSLSGEPVGGVSTFEFSTGGPAIVWSTPPDGDDAIDEEQAFVLVLDVPVTEVSLRDHVWFEVQGFPERVGVQSLADEPRRRILATLDEQTRAKPLAVIQGRQRFPSGAKVTLVWGSGVLAPSGVATMRDRRLEFTARKPFTAELSCQRENAKSACIPLTPLELRFSAPISWEQAQHVELSGPEKRHWGPKGPSAPAAFVSSVELEGPFPEASELRLTVPDGLRDDAGRALVNAPDFPLAVKTAPFPPLAKFSARFGIIEAEAEPALPVTLRNIEPDVLTRLERVTKVRRSGVRGAMRNLMDRVRGNVARVSPDHPDQILYWLRKVGRATRTKSIFGAAGPAAPAVKPFELPKPHGAGAFEVVGIPFDEPGLYVVEIESPRLGASLLGKAEPMYVPAAALVTNLAVHFKWGAPRVARMGDDARPGEARVRRARRGAELPRRDRLERRDRCAGHRAHRRPAAARKAAAMLRAASGEQTRTRGISSTSTQTQSLRGLAEGLLVTAQTDDDMSFVHSSWDDGIEPWRFQLPVAFTAARNIARTVFDRPLFRAGETVHMKHILRAPTPDGFAVPPEAERPATVEIRHEGSNEKYELPLKWDANGSAETTWEIPRQAKLGTYSVVLRRKGKRGIPPEPSGSFRVEEFRVPLMQGRVRLPGEAQVAVSQVPVELSVRYLAGGGAANLPVVLRSQIRPGTFRAGPELERFAFGNGGVRPGIVRRGMFEEEEGEESSAEEPHTVHDRQDLALDAAGTAHTVVPNLPKTGKLQELLTEMELRDPNGEVQTVSATVPLWPAKWLVGIRTDGWAASGKALRARLAVVDAAHRPVAGAPVKVRGSLAQELLEPQAAGRRLLCVRVCRGDQRRAGDAMRRAYRCRGLLLLRRRVSGRRQRHSEASVTDDAGHTSLAHGEAWVAGKIGVVVPRRR